MFDLTPSEQHAQARCQPLRAVDRAPGIREQVASRPFVAPCDHPAYALGTDTFRGGQTYCTLCGARAL